MNAIAELKDLEAIEGDQFEMQARAFVYNDLGEIKCTNPDEGPGEAQTTEEECPTVTC